LSCHETRELIHGYVDGEVDLTRSVEIEEHLTECPTCAQAYKGIRSWRGVFDDNSLRFQPTPNFEKRLRSALRNEREPAQAMRPRWQWIAAALSLACAVLIFSATALMLSRPSSGDAVAQEIVSSHVRSLMADHLTDVPSSDQHTVKPWFNGKLDFSPMVKDLSQQGFSLTGGRLDYVGNRPVAALIYQRRQHSINLFVWPAAGELSATASVHQGYNLIHWSNAGMTYWAVSDLNLAELQQFAQLLN
jgi:anti-sigma factor RsiW